MFHFIEGAFLTILGYNHISWWPPSEVGLGIIPGVLGWCRISSIHSTPMPRMVNLCCPPMSKQTIEQRDPEALRIQLHSTPYSGLRVCACVCVCGVRVCDFLKGGLVEKKPNRKTVPPFSSVPAEVSFRRRIAKHHDIDCAKNWQHAPIKRPVPLLVVDRD